MKLRRWKKVKDPKTWDDQFIRNKRGGHILYRAGAHKSFNSKMKEKILNNWLQMIKFIQYIYTQGGAEMEGHE